MDSTTAGFVGVALFVALMFLGVRIAFAALIAGLVGIVMISGPQPALMTIRSLPYSLTATYTFSIIPLFLVMGYFVASAGYAADFFWMARQWIGRFRGGLAMATVVGSAGFAAVCGASVAGAAVMGKVAIPEMTKFGYDKRLAAGCVASAGALAVMIPPSATLVIYGMVTEQSIARLLMAGILPGLLTAALLMATVWIICYRNPSVAPPGPRSTWTERFVSLRLTWPVLSLAFIVSGGIYTGIFTATEAAAVGAFAALVIGLVSRRFTKHSLWDALAESGRTTAAIFFIIFAILIFSRFLALSRIPDNFASWLVTLPVDRYVIFAGIILMYVAMGCLIDALGMLLLTLPVIYPAIVSLGFDPIWFGVICVTVTEIAVITPPFGLNVFVLRSIAPEIKLEEAFAGIWPFFFTQLVVVTILTVFPDIALYIPRLMMAR